MTDALGGAGATVRRRRRLHGVGRGVHTGWSEASTFVFRVFLVQGSALEIGRLGKPWSACLRRWALARALAGAGRGSDAGVLRVQELSEEHSLVIFGSIT